MKLGEILTGLIERRGYSRNRKAILDTVGVSAAALSQYARDEIRPSFRKLVALADFFGVSLDYLVFGEPGGVAMDHSPLAVQVNQALAEARARAHRHTALVTRIGRMLADQIEEVALRLAESPTGGRAGLVQDDELVRLERYARRADILVTELASELAGLRGEPGGRPFLHLVAGNLRRGCEYRFLVEGGRAVHEAAAAFRAQLSAEAGGDRVRRSCAFRAASTPVMAGAGFYQLDVAALTLQEPALHTQFGDHLNAEGWLGYLMRAGGSSSDMLMDGRTTKAARDTFEALWGAGTVL